MNSAALVAEAREWIGTPFKWQASVKGVGADCKGFVWGVARALGLPEADSSYASVADYGGRVPIAMLKQGMAATFKRVLDYGDGDVLLLRIGGKAQHLGIVAGGDLIHTYAGGANQVTATPLRAAFRAWLLDSAWRFPSLED